MNSKLRARLPIVAVAVLAIGGYTVGPAIAGKFLTKKAAKKTFVTKKAANKKFLKKTAASGFAKTGDSYTKAESDATFAPATDQVTFSVPPGSWTSQFDNDASIVTKSTGVAANFENTAGAPANQAFTAGVPTGLSGTATLVGARLCFVAGGDVSIDTIQLQRSQPDATTPNPAPTVLLSDGTVPISAQARCGTYTTEAATTVSPTDILALAIKADWSDSGGIPATLTITSATVTLET